MPLSLRRLPAWVLLQPFFIVPFHLTDVTRNMICFQTDPFTQCKAALRRVFQRVLPDRVRQCQEEFVSHSAEMTDYFKSSPRALMKVAQSGSPALALKLCNQTPRLGDETAAADVRVDLAVREMQDIFMDTPDAIRWFVQPHLLRELAQGNR